MRRERPADGSVVGDERGGLDEHLEGTVLVPLAGEHLGDAAELAHHPLRAAGRRDRAGRGEAGLEVVGIERADAEQGVGGAVGVTEGPAALGQRREVLLGLRERALADRDVGRLLQRVLVVGLDLEDLLVERGGLGVEAFLREVLGDAAVLLDRRSIWCAR